MCNKWNNPFLCLVCLLLPSAVAVAPLSSYIHASHTVNNMSHITWILWMISYTTFVKNVNPRGSISSMRFMCKCSDGQLLFHQHIYANFIHYFELKLLHCMLYAVQQIEQHKCTGVKAALKMKVKLTPGYTRFSTFCKLYLKLFFDKFDWKTFLTLRIVTLCKVLKHCRYYIDTLTNASNWIWCSASPFWERERERHLIWESMCVSEREREKEREKNVLKSVS